VTAYGVALADALSRSGSADGVLVPVAAAGMLLLVAALLSGGRGLGAALWLGGATYVASVAAAGHRIDPTAPLVAVLLLLSGELVAWSLDERWRIPASAELAWRRAAAVVGLAVAGLAVSTLVLALSAVPPIHGLAWTVAGAAAAVAAAGAGVWVARR
jgi:hypothetical protein